MEVLYLVLFSYVLYMLIASIGITAGYHRYFSHHEFRASALQEIIMLYCGLLCGCRSVLSWAGVHRMHHAYADTEKDPHSVKNYNWWKILFNLWKVNNIPKKFIKDLIKNKRVMFFHRYRIQIFFFHQLFFYILFGINSLIIHSIVFLLSYLGFGILNLFGHNKNGPVNNLYLNIIAPFEGSHKNHHNVSKPHIS